MSDTQKHKKPNVPNLRFPGFSGEWEKMKASDLLNFFSTNSLSWEQLEYGGSGLLNLHYGLIHNGLPTQIDIIDSSLPAIKAGNEPRKFTLCKEGDIAFADASEDTNDVGKVVEFVDCAGKNVVCGLHTIHGRDKLDKTIPGFKGYAFSSKAFRDQIMRIAQGTKVFSISAGSFDEVCVGIPGKEEQKKIAALLSLIDQRIIIQNKVIEKYESLIKALAHEIIGKNTANKTLSECVCCTSSTLKESDLEGDGVVPAYGAAGISGYTKSALTKKDSILITKDGSGVGTLRYVHGPHSFVGTLNSMTPKEGIYLPYIYYALQNVCLENYRTGQAIPHIYFRDYGKEPIYCPSFDDQKRLAKGLEMIDAKVDVERATLKSLQSVKAHLLSVLFI